ncbi:MAG: hypothetical protein E7Z85_04490 [Methanosphaera stadtmanae]|nr:hypothetical protein [Methanosphaera stadtmanae]
MINFMLPTQIGAITLDGTWLIAVGVILVAGIIYYNRNNISLMSSETNINKDSNINSNMEIEKVDIQTSQFKEDEIRNLEEENIVLDE